jgi:hypothetical protein
MQNVFVLAEEGTVEGLYRLNQQPETEMLSRMEPDNQHKWYGNRVKKLGNASVHTAVKSCWYPNSCNNSQGKV